MHREEYGYSDLFEEGRVRAGFGAFAVARVIAEHRELYRVADGVREYAAKITGKQMFTAMSREDYPAVGDWVAITEADSEHAVIRGILPRRSVVKRKESGGADTQVIAANVDVAFIVQAVGRDFSINRCERYAASITSGGVRPSIILNKADLVSKSELDEMVESIRTRLPAVDVVTASTFIDGGLDDVVATLARGSTYCFIGSSGVGKSSIINALLKNAVLETGEIGTRTKRGKHVTTARALFLLDSGAMVIDNPGMREFGVVDSESGIERIFDEIVNIAVSCKFSDCAHENETGCAVRAAIDAGTVSEAQFESYMKLKRENEFAEMTDVQRRQKDKAFGKFVKKALTEIERSRE